MAFAGCGGGGDGGSQADPSCSDRLFRAQDEELYVAQTTVQNALSAPESAEAVGQLRQGARVLRRYVDAHPPCADDLRDAEELEQQALVAIDDAAAQLAGDPQSEDARAGLQRALADLREAGRRIRPEAIPGG